MDRIVNLQKMKNSLPSELFNSTEIPGKSLKRKISQTISDLKSNLQLKTDSIRRSMSLKMSKNLMLNAKVLFNKMIMKNL